MDTYETKIYIALLIGGSILALLFIFFVVSLMKHQKKNVTLYKEKVQAEINTLENERSRFVSDLHDDFGPVLSSVKLHVASLSPSSPEDEALQQKSLSLINDMLSQIHQIANNLMPNALRRKGVVIALKQFADDINNTGKINISVTSESNELNVVKENEIHIYRIIQEAIHNTLKHSKAERMSINFKEAPGEIHFTIDDNGVGYNYDAHRKNSLGLGLKNIISRVEMLNGEIFIDTAVGKGTHYSIIIPNAQN
ncbi:sensor histidine kinase [Sediminibacterium roseum]|uniref:histidine kinase n=1 Tax=Sediminibacterium roseum TaxID=1978412 RepID=A0ABW9ZZ89_9BACT|nr:ATP-binding protein [Sediminibacterium roseum]NCI51637.1 sensor histidine kinase [Sediminibacterium roseum]